MHRYMYMDIYVDDNICTVLAYIGYEQLGRLSNNDTRAEHNTKIDGQSAHARWIPTHA